MGTRCLRLVPVSQVQSRTLLRSLQVVVSPGDVVHLVRIHSGKFKGSRVLCCLLHRSSSVLGVSWALGHSSGPWACVLTLYLTFREKPGAGVGYPHPGHWGPRQEWKQTQVRPLSVKPCLFYPSLIGSHMGSTIHCFSFYETNNVKNFLPVLRDIRWKLWNQFLLPVP